MWLVYLSCFFGGWWAFCAVADALAARRSRPVVIDPCAESRARASALRADCAQLPGGTR